MPYVRVEPELFLEHKGIDVFHTYDCGDSSPSRYWFTTDADNADEFRGHGREGQFDARRFARLCDGTPNVAQWEQWWRPRFKLEDEAIEALIVGEIDAGHLDLFRRKKPA